MPSLLVIHGPNLNMLGKREPDIYGKSTIEDINLKMKERAEEEDFNIDFFQSNHEGAIVDRIQEAGEKYDYILLNAAAFTHYSIAIRDAIAGISVPVIEIHLSNVHKRESFRHISVIAPVVEGQILGFGSDSYMAALEVAIRKLKKV